MLTTPAINKTATWDVVAWNGAASLVLADYGTLPLVERNILRLAFRDDRHSGSKEDWERTARFLVGTLRADTMQGKTVPRFDKFITELCAISTKFAALWADDAVRFHGEGAQRLHHLDIGVLEVEYTSFAVQGRPDLGLIVYNPIDPQVASLIQSLLKV